MKRAHAALEEVCPRCGSPRESGQRYCLECGLELPRTTGALAGLRRVWVDRIGWYPGDWIWTTLLALLVAVAGAAVAIVSTRGDRGSTAVTTLVATRAAPPATAPGATSTRQPTRRHSTPGARPKPKGEAKGKAKAKRGTAAGANGLTAWPAGRAGWTIVLESLPATRAGRKQAEARAARAAARGLPEVGVLTSSRYASLHPGYVVVFSGVYDNRGDAESTLHAAAAAGFSSAYVREIAR